jgi:hypothetical protein
VPRHSQVDPDFKKHVCERIDRYIADHDMSDVEAASVLGVTKQVIGDYRRAKSLPGTEVIARVCIYWSLTFDYHGFEISAKTFASQNGKPKAVPLQLELPFGEPLEFRGVSERVQDVQLTITLRRVS